MWLNNNGKSSGLLPGRESVGPLALMCITPVFIFILWFTMQHLGGDFGKLIENFQAVSQTGGAGWDQPLRQLRDQALTRLPLYLHKTQNGWGYLKVIVPTPFDPTAWKVILSYMAVELAFMR